MSYISYLPVDSIQPFHAAKWWFYFDMVWADMEFRIISTDRSKTLETRADRTDSSDTTYRHKRNNRRTDFKGIRSKRQYTVSINRSS